MYDPIPARVPRAAAAHRSGAGRGFGSLLLGSLLCTCAPVTAQTVCDGAPDEGGYMCWALDGPFDVVLTPSGVEQDDQVSAAIPLGFPFNFYNVDYTAVYVADDGFVTLLPDQEGCCSGQPMPSSASPNAVIAGLWTDLNPFAGGEINAGVLGRAPDRRFVVSWQEVPYFSLGDNPVSFQIVLHERGDVEIRFGDIGAADRTISVGIEDELGTQGLEIYHGVGAPAGHQGFLIGKDSAAEVGGPYRIAEGDATVTLSGARSRGEIVSYAWDLDLDGQYDDAQGIEAVLDTSALDGPLALRFGLRVVEADQEVSTDEGTLLVANVAPVVTSTPPTTTIAGRTFRYEVVAEDPGGELDPLSYTLLRGPDTAALSASGVLTWAATQQDIGPTFPFHIRVDDGDGGAVEHAFNLLVIDPDADADGVLDDVDNCVGAANPEQLDTDGDLRGDVCDEDDDGDGVPDAVDNCPLLPNPAQDDTDGDDDGDACDEDDDADGAADVDDNCPLEPNPDQTDLDGDGAGDACDDDRDGDGLDNAREAQLGTDPDDADSDGDGLRDGTEVDELGTNPRNADTDLDGAEDGDEVERGTDPLRADSDSDGLLDGDEAQRGTDPLRADTDGDGLTDGDEAQRGTDPLRVDTDGDGLEDGDEVNTHRTDPSVADSDGGTVDDGVEVGRGSDPNDATDDVPAPDDSEGTPIEPDPGRLPPPGQDCGCSTWHRRVAAPVALTLWLAVLAGMLLRRRGHATRST